MDYKSAGVDTHKAQELIFSLKDKITATHKNLATGKVGGSYGSFAGVFEPSLSSNGKHLVATTDGVGTKIELCRKYNYFEGLGYDLTAMCVNDLYCTGATALFFLDYISCGKLDETWYNAFLISLTKALQEINVALLGGETAEHPDVMKDDEFDVAGFAVGMVLPQALLPNLDVMQEEDVLLAFSSNGLHSNGFSLVRKIFAKIEQEGTEEQKEKIANRDWVIKNILAPTRIYNELPSLLNNFSIKGLAHITGGGIYENLPRILPKHLDAQIENPKPFDFEVFDFLNSFVSKKDMYATFNMGIGMIAVLSKNEADKLVTACNSCKVIGKLVAGSSQVLINEQDLK